MPYNFPLTPINIAAPAGGIVEVASFTGAGAAAITVSTSTVMTMAANAAARTAPTITRNGVGDHTIAFAIGTSPAKAYVVIPVCEGVSDLDATIRSVAISSGVLTVRVLTKTAPGVAADLTASVEFLKLLIVGSNSTAG